MLILGWTPYRYETEFDGQEGFVLRRDGDGCFQYVPGISDAVWRTPSLPRISEECAFSAFPEPCFWFIYSRITALGLIPKLIY